jgi:RHS repeat-associated protein
MDTITTGGNKPEKLQFYYHPDHLGSSSFITDISGEVYQHIEYFPFGETFIEERTDAEYTSYLFNGKELDEETGLYYYGARYYDARISMFYGVDPHAENYYPISPYAYVANNPIIRIDPDGRDIWEINNQGEIVNRIEDKNQDKFISVSFDSEGNKVEGQSISFEYGTVTAVRTPTVKVRDSQTGDVVEKKLTTFEMKGDENATQLFEFFADPANTSVEWTDAKIGTESSGRNIVGSSHDESSTAVGAYLRQTGYTLREVSHNHPSGIARPSRGDRAGAQQYHNRNQNTILKIYTHPGNYVEYNQFGIVLPPVIVTP